MHIYIYIYIDRDWDITKHPMKSCTGRLFANPSPDGLEDV